MIHGTKSGYRCRKACVRDKQCTWQNNKCRNRATGLVGVPMPQCPLACANRDTAIDVLWALDESNSVTQSPQLFSDMVKFIQNVLRVEEKIAEHPDLGGSRHAVVEFSGQSFFEPGKYQDIGLSSDFSQPRATSPKDFLDFIKSLVPSGGFTRTDIVLEFAKNLFLAQSLNPLRRKVLVLMTDGLPTDEYGFPGTPTMMDITYQAAADLQTETKAGIILIKTSSAFPTGDQTGFLAPFVNSSIDFHHAKLFRQAQLELFEQIFVCRD